MLTVGEETLKHSPRSRASKSSTHLYGQEINPETYAICKADMLLKGEGENADHIVGGAEWSTLSHDAFPAQEFDFMLSNPPYGKSWKKDLAMGGKDGMRDPRFKVRTKAKPNFRSSPAPATARCSSSPTWREDERQDRRSAAASPRFTTARRSSPATPARARATSAAGSSRTTG